jgi:hypothetical protein
MVAAASDLRAGVCEDDATMSERDDLLDVIATREATIYAQAEQIAALQKALKRAAYVAEHLFAMIDRETWRDNGADDGQGHYEGDYHAEQVRDEIAGWKALALAEGCAAPAPGMTDLMVTPESIDAYLAENPPPPAPAPEEEK